jgi:hypothetical protein
LQRPVAEGDLADNMVELFLMPDFGKVKRFKAGIADMRVRVQFGGHRGGAGIKLHPVKFNSLGGGLEKTPVPQEGSRILALWRIGWALWSSRQVMRASGGEV